MPKINFSEEQVLENFVRQMVTDKGLLEEDRNQNGKIQHELLGALDAAIEKAMIAALPDAKLMELNQLLDAGADDAQIETVFAGAGVNYEVVAGRTMAAFREAYLSKGDSTMADTANNSAAVQMPDGRPVQGATSEVPGSSDVEGVAQNGEER